MNIGIDSQIVVYGGIAPSVAKSRGPEHAELVMRAGLFFHEHQKDSIFLPTVAVTEIMVPVRADQKGLLAARLAERFTCPMFDLHAASIAADLWALHKKLPAGQQYTDRHVLRADAMIIASLKAAGVQWFFSHDKKCRKLAELVYMTARDLPVKPTSDTPEGLLIASAMERGEVPEQFSEKPPAPPATKKKKR